MILDPDDEAAAHAHDHEVGVTTAIFCSLMLAALCLLLMLKLFESTPQRRLHGCCGRNAWQLFLCLLLLQ